MKTVVVRQACMAIACAISLAVRPAFADLWVCGTRGDDENGDGSSAAPYKTIQKAVSAVTGAGGVIRVAEGVYANGAADVWKDTPSRVKIDGTKYDGLKIIGDGRGKTVIRGTRPEGLGKAFSSEATKNDGSPCRCVHIANATGVVIEKLTLEGGETRNSLSGGGICLNNADAMLVDCEIRNCTAGKGAAAFGGDDGVTLVRTYITDTYAKNDGGAVFGKATLVNCVVSRTMTDGTGSAVSGAELYNCTLADNQAASAAGASSRVVNSLIVISSSELGASELGDGSTSENSVLGSVAEGGHFQIAAPTLGDFRPLSGSEAATAALAANLEEVKLPGGVSAMNDIHGSKIEADDSGRIAAGAVQQLLEPVTGRLVFTNEYHAVEGKISRNASKFTWIYPESYPTQYRISAAVQNGWFFRWQRSDDGDFTYPSWKDASAWITPSPDVGGESVYTATTVHTIYYVKPDGDDNAAGTSEATAWRTLAKAASAPNPNFAAFVYVLPGVYSAVESGNTFEAGGKTYGGDSVFSINSKQLAFVAKAGPEQTIIEGRSCAEGKQKDENYPGCGAGALNIAVLRNSCALVGFTLRGGRSVADSAPGVVQAMNAGGSPQLVECVISNNVSMYYGMGIACSRCRIYSNVSKLDTVAIRAVQCDLRDNQVLTGGYGAVRNFACFSTVVGTPRSGNLSAVCKSVNSIWDGGEEIYSSWSSIGSLCWNYGKASTSSRFLDADPLFVNRADSSRLISISPAVGAALPPTVENCAEYPWYLYLGADLDGNPVRWNNGRATIGAYQATVPGVAVFANERGGYALDGVREGVNALDENTVIKIRPDKGTRPCIGVEVNGVLRTFADNWTAERGYEISLGMADAIGGGIDIKPAYSGDWYVDDDGDDANTGFLPKLAKRTLATAEGFLGEGDTLRVLPGVYDCGSNRLDDAETVWSRVVVGRNRRVVSTDGPEKTFIVGADATVNPDEYGCGANAMRCATVRHYGTLEGFTLTGGRVNRDFLNNQGGMGGGVIGENSHGSKPSYQTRVVNCIISNCTAAVGAGAVRVQLARSRVLENTATSYGSGAYQTCAYGCYFDRNIGNGVLDHMLHLVSCTVGAGNRTSSGEMPNAVQYHSEGAMIVNTLLAQPMLLSPSGACTIRYSAYPAESDLAAGEADDTCISSGAENLVLDPGGRPVIGANAGVDNGGFGGFSDEYGMLDPACDQSGFQRVMNGRMDIGCYEADWAAVYARDLGAPYGVRVEGASAEVSENRLTGKIDMPSSSTLSLSCSNASVAGYRYEFSFIVRQGTLSLAVGGGEAETYVASENVYTVVLSGDEVTCLAAAVSPDGAATLLSCRRRAGFRFILR